MIFLSLKICTIGFSKKSLRKFVNLLKDSNVTDLIDVRLNNTSQLSGFAKKDDLKFIMDLIGINYIHDVGLAPEEQLLDDYKKKQVSWFEYEKIYLQTLEKRNVQERINKIIGKGISCFLCSEDKPEYCHRRLLVNFIQQHLDEKIEVKHLI